MHLCVIHPVSLCCCSSDVMFTLLKNLVRIRHFFLVLIWKNIIIQMTASLLNSPDLNRNPLLLPLQSLSLFCFNFYISVPLSLRRTVPPTVMSKPLAAPPCPVCQVAANASHRHTNRPHHSLYKEATDSTHTLICVYTQQQHPSCTP